MKRKETGLRAAWHSLIPLGIGISLIYWIGESAIDAYIFHLGTLGERIIPADPDEIWMRFSIIFLIVTFSIYSQSLISKSVRTEESLRRERNFIASVLDTMAALAVVLDQEGRIMRFNRACEETTGYTLGEVNGRYLWDLFLTEEEKEPVKVVFRQLSSGKFPGKYENYWLTKDGRRRLISWSNTAIVGNDGSVEYIIGTGIDITEQKRLEGERRDLLSMFAHDMKNPVVSAAGFLSRLLSGKGGPLHEKQLDYLRILQEDITVLEKLVSDFLEFSRFEAKEYKPILVPMNIKTAIFRVVEMTKMQASRKNVALLLDLPESVPNMIYADAALMERVISNLLDNALKYTDPGGSVAVRLEGRDTHILVQVIDTGKGIPEDHLLHIFDAFYRVERDTTGSGLGLSIVKKIVEAHGGIIWVDSVTGKGSTFHFTLPKG